MHHCFLIVRSSFSSSCCLLRTLRFARRRAIAAMALLSRVLAIGAFAAAQTPGIGVRNIDVSLNEVDSTTEAVDIALRLGATQEPYVVHRDITSVVPALNIGDPGTFADSLAYPGGYGMPGDEAHFVDVANANVTIPAGKWQIAFGSDDGGALALLGVNFFDEFGEEGPSPLHLTGNGKLRYEAPRGH
jgi:hypothetical protein